MRITVIASSNQMFIDGEQYPVDCSSLPKNVSGIQWYGDKGHLEINNNNGLLETKPITSFDAYKFLIDLWQAAKNHWGEEKNKYEN